MAVYLSLAVLAGVSALATLLICINADHIGRSLGLLDRPDGVRKLHAEVTPLVGGLAVMAPVFALSLFAAWFANLHNYVEIAALAAVAILLLGLTDDRRGLNAVLRLVAIASATLIAFLLDPLFVLHTLRLDLFGLEMVVGFGAASMLVTLVIIVGFVNAANMADGMNGQLLGSVMIWTGFLLCYVPPEVSLPYIALLLSASVAFIFNLRGALFSGSAGAYSASLFLALSAIATYRIAGETLPAEVPALWFYLPVLDCLRLFAQRMIAGRSPLSADRNHFHHILLRHMGAKQALAAYLFLLAFPGAMGLVALDFGSIALIPCVVVYGVLILRAAAHHPEMAPVQAE